MFTFSYCIALKRMPRRKDLKVVTSKFSRTANQGGASDSSGMAGALFRPPTPEMEEVGEDDGNDGNDDHDDVQVEEEAFVEVRTEGGALMATPFFSQDNGTTLIRGGTVVNHDKVEVADVLVEDGKIVAVGQDLELPQVRLLFDDYDFNQNQMIIMILK